MKDRNRQNSLRLLETFQQILNQFPLKPGDKIVVAVSGGADSVCLLHLLRQCPYLLHVAHLNHGLRPEATEEAAFVKALCDAWGIPSTLATRSVPTFCKAHHLSKQAGARHLRYAFLKEVAQAVDARWVATGHTANDQAETFLMRLVRGSGSQGLKGIPKIREETILRPLLEIHRDQILEELTRSQISYREDPTNAQPIYLRNRIRHGLLPQLADHNPNIIDTLCREASLLGDEDDFMTQHLLQRLPDLDIKMDPHRIRFHLPKLVSLHPALQRRLLRFGMAHLQGNLNEVEYHQVETIRRHIDSNPQRVTWTLPKKLRMVKAYPDLTLESDLAPQSHREDPSPVEIFIGASPIQLPEWGMSLTLHRYAGFHPPPSPCAASFDFDKIAPPLLVRGWRKGDRFSPSGMKGRHKKLQDFFMDSKIPRQERGLLPLLACPRGILWIIGRRTDACFEATAGTKETLVVEVASLKI